MTTNPFLRLKKYAGSMISQDENYATEALAMLLDGFPSFRSRLVSALFGQEIELAARVRTQVAYETRRFGRAILDLVIEDSGNFIAVEIKVEAGLNYYAGVSDTEPDQITYDQIAKYEDCKGLPTDKKISFFTLSKYPLNLEDASYKYFKPGSNQLLWRQVFIEITNYSCSLTVETPEKYLLNKFTQYLKEERMAGFQRFKIDDIANLSQRLEVDAVCADHRSLIMDNIILPDFKSNNQKAAYNRDGVVYEWKHDKGIKIFAGLWLSDEGYYFKFPRETGPQVMVFFELPPKHALRSSILSSQELTRVSKEFGREKDGWQILLRRRPLIEFMASDDQAKSLLNFYLESINDIQRSGLLQLLKS